MLRTADSFARDEMLLAWSYDLARKVADLARRVP